MKSVYHHAIGKVLSNRYKKDMLNTLKNNLDFKNLCLLADGISTAFKPLNFSIYGNSLPKTIEELGKGDTLYKPEAEENEIKWLLLSIRKFSKELSLFLILKKDFEKNFLQGNYKKAEKILETIAIDIGYSLWYIESKFLLLEYQNKSEEQKEFLSKINEINKHGIIGTLSHFLSYRTERNLSAYKYDYDINSIFRINKNKLENDIRGYYLFRLNIYENRAVQDYSAITLFESNNSVIDRYLILRDVLKNLSLNKLKKDFLLTTVKYIYKKTKDCQILPLIYLFDAKSNIKEYYNDKYTRILDLYYSGLYEETIIECQKFLLTDVSNFDVIVIYAYSHINIGRDIIKVTEEQNSLLNQICLKVYELISSTTIRKDLIYNLYQINKNVLSFDLSTGIDYFLKKEQNYKVNRAFKLLSINSFDPHFTSLYADELEANLYLSNGLKFFADSISIKHRINFLNNNLSRENKISKELYSIDTAKIFYNQNRFDESIVEWKLITKNYQKNIPITQTALKYWFDCLIKLELYNDAINLFVEQYIFNPNVVSKINTDSLLEILRKIRYKGIKRTIDLPIFVSLTSIDETEKSFILEQFCMVNNASIPSNLFDLTLSNDKNKVGLFYYNVCNSETLKHSIYLNNTIERLTERLNIINFLIEEFPNDKKIYQEELNLITNELIVYEGNQKLEESKIYANDQAIINYELNEIEGLFNRYKTIYKLSLKDKKILVLTKSSYALLRLDGKEKYNETEVKYTDSALLEVFAELFDSILDKYLFSKFGIVAYLSTRIRHGVLLGEIRPEIDKQNLILNRIGNTSTYQESKYWNQSAFGLTQTQKNRLHEILSTFSFKIDTLIEDIIRDRIQIKKDGKNENGLFNYEFDKSELYEYAIELAHEEDAKTFSQKLIDIIWKRTDANLEVIREYIDKKIKNKFSEEINYLDTELKKSIFDVPPLIFTNITECSTIIENKLNKISSWFRRSGSTISDFNIQRVLEIVWNNTKKSYPKILAECSTKFEINPTIKSNFYIHFTDLFRIMLENMFKYGAYKNNKKEFEFRCYTLNGIMICSFSNDKEKDDGNIPLTSKDGQLTIDTAKLISENKSGISKAVKIVKFDLDNENNSIKLNDSDSDKFLIEIAININNLVKDEANTNS
jgi:hypothetical protein